MAFDLTIIVPVYNEDDNLTRLESELVAFLKISVVPTCVLFVNDGSTDNSLNHIRQICSKHDAFNYISFEKNNGLSSALKAGFDSINTPFTGYIDADLQTTPEDFNLLLPHRFNYELVTGMRQNRKDTFLKKLISKMANKTRRIFTGDGMDDTGCPLKVIKTDYAKRIPMFKGLHRFLPAMILLQNGKVVQLPVRHFPRQAGTTKFRLSNRFISPMTDCLAYLWMKKRYINYQIHSEETTNS